MMIKNFLENVEKYGIRLLLIGINNPIDFVDADDDADELITADIYKNTSFVVEGNRAVIVLHSVINDYLKTLV